jgi:multidrug efflux pump subunit AcrB
VIVLACVATLVSIVPLGGKANKNFLPEEDESQFGITCGRPRASSLDATRIIADARGGRLEKLPEGVVRRHDDRRRPQQTQNLATST